MKCSYLWSCIEFLIAGDPIAILYQTGLVYLLPFIAAVVGFGALGWQRSRQGSAPKRQRQLGGVSWITVAVVVSILLTLPAAIFKASPSSLETILGIPSDASIFQLDQDVFITSASLVKWAAWAAVFGVMLALATAWGPIRYWGALHRTGRGGFGSLSPSWPSTTPRPPANTPGDNYSLPGEVTPIRKESNDKGDFSSSVAFDSEQTIAPPSRPYQPPDRRVAWIELQWIDGSPYKGNPSRWRIDQQQHPIEIGRIPEGRKLFDYQIGLPDAARTVSKKQVEVGANREGYHLINVGKERVKIGKELVQQDAGRQIPLESGASIKIGRYDLVFWEISYPIVTISSPDLSKETRVSAPDRFTIGSSADYIDVGADTTLARVYFDTELGGFFIRKVGIGAAPIYLDERPLEDDPLPLHDGSKLSYFSYDLQFMFPSF